MHKVCLVVLAAAHLLARAAGFCPAVTCRRPFAMGSSGAGWPGAQSDAGVLQAVERRRGSPPRGTVGELHQKHLLALNIRSLPDAPMLAPRAYLLSRETAQAFGGAAAAAAQIALGSPALRQRCLVDGEMQEFELDFLVSQAAALLRAATCPPDPARTARARPAREDVELAAAVCRAYLTPATRRWALTLSTQDRARLCHGIAPAEAPADAPAGSAGGGMGAAESGGGGVLNGGETADSGGGAAEEVLAELGRLPHLQLDLLESNVWIVKPATGAMGRGIAFVPGAGAGGAEGGAAGAGGGGGVGESKPERSDGDGLGYVVQKYLEKPHLVSPERLWLARLAGADVEAGAGVEVGADGQAGAGGDAQGRFKYNVRFWLQVAWSSACPEAWLYEDGYIELADAPFEPGDFSQPCAHVTNLSRPPGRGAAATPPRLWTSSEYCACLSASCVEDEQALARDLVPRVAALAARVLASISMQQRPPAAAAGAGEGEDEGLGTEGVGKDSRDTVKWKRFGMDVAVDEACGLWLIEFNANPGMRAPRSRLGDAKRVLVQRFLRHELLLKDWRRAAGGGGAREARDAREAREARKGGKDKGGLREEATAVRPGSV